MITIETIISLVAIIFSGLSVIFIALPYRKSLEPRLRVEIKGKGKKDEIQECLEYGDLRVYVENVSNNFAENIIVEFDADMKYRSRGKNVYKKVTHKEKIPYLHPGEISTFPLNIISILHKRYSDLFIIHRKSVKGGVTFERKIPKKNLKINLRIKLNSGKYSTYDDFYLEWHSRDSSPEWGAPRILCWNKRKDKYIIKKK